MLAKQQSEKQKAALPQASAPQDSDDADPFADFSDDESSSKANKSLQPTQSVGSGLESLHNKKISATLPPSKPPPQDFDHPFADFDNSHTHSKMGDESAEHAQASSPMLHYELCACADCHPHSNRDGAGGKGECEHGGVKFTLRPVTPFPSTAEFSMSHSSTSGSRLGTRGLSVWPSFFSTHAVSANINL